MKSYKLKALSLHFNGRVLKKEHDKVYSANELGGQEHATYLEQLGWIEEVKNKKAEVEQDVASDSPRDLSKKELIEALEVAGVDYDPKAKKYELLELYKAL